MATTSVLVIFILLITKVINLDIIKHGLIGDGFIEPWKVIVIFFSVAYVSVSTDVTGVFDYLAYQIVRLTRGSGLKLFFAFYCFAGLLSVFTSNDIVILTLTPIIFYLGKHAKINIIPLLFAEFFAANTFSMLLYIDNPTNIILVNSMGIGFLEYLSVMWLPTTIAIITTFILLRLVFRKSITKTYKLNPNSKFSVRSGVDVIISSALMLLMFVFLVLSEKLALPIWKITLLFAILFIIEDLLFSIYYYIKSHKLSAPQLEKRKVVLGIPEDKNEFWLAIKRVPWKILPFVATFFILVYFLNQIGIINAISELMFIERNSLLASIGISGIASFITANIINNQPMAILFTHIFASGKMVLDSQNLLGGVYATIIASNLAANFTIVGALAGLMWKKILRTKDVRITYLDFLKKGLLITPLVFIITLLTLYFTLHLL